MGKKGILIDKYDNNKPATDLVETKNQKTVNLQPKIIVYHVPKQEKPIIQHKPITKSINNNKVLVIQNKPVTKKISNNCVYFVKQNSRSNEYEGYFSDDYEIECSRMRRGKFNCMDTSLSSESTLTLQSSSSTSSLADSQQNIQFCTQNDHRFESNLKYNKMGRYSVSNLTNTKKHRYRKYGI